MRSTAAPAALSKQHPSVPLWDDIQAALALVSIAKDKSNASAYPRRN